MTMADINLNQHQPSEIWSILTRSCINLLKDNGSIEANLGLQALDLDSGIMPSLEELNLRLRYVGWTVTPVHSFISSKLFLKNLANRVLPISIHMRVWDEIAFSAAPDYFHEGFGHVCLLANPDIRKFLQRYGEIGLKCFSFEGDDQYLEKLSDTIAIRKYLPENSGPQIVDLQKEEVSELVQLTRLGWWTFEMGLIQQDGRNKVWGAALISSSSEIQSFSTKPAMPLTLDCVWHHFDPSIHQEKYFYIESIKQLNLLLDEFEKGLAATSGGFDGCLKAFKSKSECSIRIRSSQNEVQTICGKVLELTDQTAEIQDSISLSVVAFDFARIIGIEPIQDESPL